MMFHRAHVTLPLLMACILVAGCGPRDPADRRAVTPTVPIDLDTTCDRAIYPLPVWIQCEATNFARESVAPAEQLDPAFLARLAGQQSANAADWLTRANADPSWLDPRSLNTPVLPVCATWAGPCIGDPFRYPEAPGADGQTFYANEAVVTPVVFYDRDCARISGRVWRPKAASGTLPQVVITNGSIQASETMYWYLAQALVRAGYAVLTYDPRGQGHSDQQAPDGAQGSNLGAKVFWEGQVDAIDFAHSTASQPYPHGAHCAGTYPTLTDDFNPQWQFVDRQRLGIAGHSLGAIGVSVVQGYGAPGADPWPGQLDATNPVKAAVGLDSLILPDGSGFTPADNLPLPPEMLALLIQVGTEGTLPKFGARAPAMNFGADYGLFSNVPYALPPDPERHELTFALWRQSGVPVYTLSIQGTTHLDFSPAPGLPATSWCPSPATGICEDGYAQPAIIHYALAWFDRWLKQPGEAGYADADARLVDDAGPQGAVKMSFRFRSARDFPDRSGHRQHCDDVRAGCS